MRDEDLSALERAVLSGDRSSLFKLRVAYWRLGPPELALPDGGVKFAQGAPLIRQKPGTEARVDHALFSVRALNAIHRLLGVSEIGDMSLKDLAGAVSEAGLRRQRFAGTKTIDEIRGVLSLADLELKPSEPISRDDFPETTACDSCYQIVPVRFLTRSGLCPPCASRGLAGRFGTGDVACLS